MCKYVDVELQNCPATNVQRDEYGNPMGLTIADEIVIAAGRRATQVADRLVNGIDTTCDGCGLEFVGPVLYDDDGAKPHVRWHPASLMGDPSWHVEVRCEACADRLRNS